jgi:hypothetical protein
MHIDSRDIADAVNRLDLNDATAINSSLNNRDIAWDKLADNLAMQSVYA